MTRTLQAAIGQQHRSIREKANVSGPVYTLDEAAVRSLSPRATVRGS
jgi:hypothetical protein